MSRQPALSPASLRFLSPVTWETDISTDMRSPTLETHIPSDMCSPTLETHIPSDICSLPGKHITLKNMCSPAWETRILSDM